MRVIQLWEDEQIYAKSFTEVLKQYLKPQLDIARQRLQQSDLAVESHSNTYHMGKELFLAEQAQRLLAE